MKILGTACSNEQEGSGFVVGPGLVATNAHVIAGEGSGNTQVLVGGTAYGATPVYLDPSFDLAVLRTSVPLGPVLTISSSLAPNGTQAALLGYPEDGPLTVNPALCPRRSRRSARTSTTAGRSPAASMPLPPPCCPATRADR